MVIVIVSTTKQVAVEAKTQIRVETKAVVEVVKMNQFNQLVS
jgi:hypothetical protein